MFGFGGGGDDGGLQEQTLFLKGHLEASSPLGKYVQIF